MMYLISKTNGKAVKLNPEDVPHVARFVFVLIMSLFMDKMTNSQSCIELAQSLSDAECDLLNYSPELFKAIMIGLNLKDFHNVASIDLITAEQFTA